MADLTLLPWTPSPSLAMRRPAGPSDEMALSCLCASLLCSLLVLESSPPSRLSPSVPQAWQLPAGSQPPAPLGQGAGGARAPKSVSQTPMLLVPSVASATGALPGHGNMKRAEDALVLSLDAEVPFWPWTPVSCSRSTAAPRLLPGPSALPTAPSRGARPCCASRRRRDLGAPGPVQVAVPLQSQVAECTDGLPAGGSNTPPPLFLQPKGSKCHPPATNPWHSWVCFLGLFHVFVTNPPN